VANLFSRIAPQIFGGEMIKQAVACLLFGGSRKACPGRAGRPRRA
jgi:DNA replicative helicase MCM subunit Mcm2 (Cdc46/Mcm family)